MVKLGERLFNNPLITFEKGNIHGVTAEDIGHSIKQVGLPASLGEMGKKLGFVDDRESNQKTDMDNESKPCN